MTGSSQCYTVFPTAIGSCALVWHDAGILWVQLPDESVAATRRRVQARFPEAVEVDPTSAPVKDDTTHITRAVAGAVADIQALLDGQPRDLSHLPLDMQQTPAFHRRVYEMTRAIGPGSVSTYGDVARAVGSPGAARAVGQALARNPFAIVVPCHRVLAAGHRPGGFSAPGGIVTKSKMLEIEQAPLGLKGL